VVFAVGVLYPLRIRPSNRTPSRDHGPLGRDATKRSTGFREWWRSLNVPSRAAAPLQMAFMGLVVVAFGLLLAWVSPGTLFWPVGFLLLGALGIYGGIRRIQEDRSG